MSQQSPYIYTANSYPKKFCTKAMRPKRKTFLFRLAVCCMVLSIFLIQSAAARAKPSIQAQGLPDLIVESVVIVPSESGEARAVDIKVTILNQGQADAKDFTSYLYLDTADDPPTAETDYTTLSRYNLTLPPGWTHVYERIGHVSDLATPDVKVWIDPPWENTVAESNEENNLYPPPAEAPHTEGADSYENDDDCSDANPISLSEVQERNLYRNPTADFDWAYFEAEAGVTYYIQAIADGIDADLYLETHEECGGSPPFGAGATAEVTPVNNGSIYLKVAHVRSSSYGTETAYRLRVDVQGDCLAYFEPNNSCSVANSGYLALNEAALINEDDALRAQTICKPRDSDWMRFEAIAGTTYTLTVSNLREQSDTQLAIFENCEDAAKISPEDALDGIKYQVTAAKSGFLYVEATHADDSEFGDDTFYRIDLEAADSAIGCAPDQQEDDDSIAQAKPFTIGEQKTYTTCPAADPDWIQFRANAGITYSIETFNLASDADTVICLHDSAGEQLICNDDGGAGKASRLVWQAPIDDLYLLKVKNFDDEIAGERSQFDLTIRTDACRADAHEPDSTLTSARLVTPNDLPTKHNICTANDEDWLWFNAQADVSYIIETSNTALEADTIIELYNAAGEQVAQNDDFQRGTESRISLQTASPGRYYARVRLFNQTNFGTGTEYSLQVREGEATDTDVPIIIEPAVEDAAQGPPTDIKTLIVVNGRSIAEQYGQDQADLLTAKLEDLAVHPLVRGQIIRLDDQAIASNAYARWKRDPVSIEQANQTAAAIRQSIEQTLRSNGSVESIVLVGDDRALPFYRIPLNTTLYFERDYKLITDNHPTGSALRNNYYLTDDYFADREPTLVNGRELYLPDFAIGRLIETPDDMIGIINNFLENPTTRVEKVGISAYTFVKDSGQAECNEWQSRFTASSVDCSLIGENWNAQDWAEISLNPADPVQILSINGHATHSAFGTPSAGSKNITSADIVASEVKSMPGGLVYSMSCHAGLNVPPSNTAAGNDRISPTDSPEVFVRKGANYIGSTGYSYGSRSAMLWTEAVLTNFSTILVNSDQSMGHALRSAKIQYYNEKPKFTAFDEKAIQQLVFYGLPMFKISGGGALGPNNVDEDEFPTVGFTTDLPPDALGIQIIGEETAGEEELVIGTATINFPDDLPLALSNEEAGEFYALDGYTTAAAGEPMQPFHFGTITRAANTARSAIIRSATYAIKTEFDPLIALPFNEYTTAAEQQPDALSGTYPPVPISVRAHNGESKLVTSVSQFDAEAKSIRVLDDVKVDLFYSNSPDRTAPTILFVDSNYNPATKQVNIKVEAADASEIKAVFISYFDESVDLKGVINSWELTYHAESQKWLGSFTHNRQPQFYVQVIDRAGNARSAVNKGMYYKPGIWTEVEVEQPNVEQPNVEQPDIEQPAARKIFLPAIRQ